MRLQKPFDTFRVERHAGEYKDFQLPADSTYPLKGVTYPVDYGDIEGYVAEDGSNLDVFVGKGGDISGYFVVARPELAMGEHKFYLGVNELEESAILDEFDPVIIERGQFKSFEELVQAIQLFRQGR